MDKELEGNRSWQMAIASNEINNKQETHIFAASSLNEPYPLGSSWFAQMLEAQQKGKRVCVSWDNPEEPKEEFKVATHWDEGLEKLYEGQVFAESGQLQQNSGRKDSTEGGNNSSFAGQQSLGSRKTGEKRRTKTEKTISLEVLRQYFAGSLKDAAKSIGGRRIIYHNWKSNILSNFLWLIKYYLAAK